MFFFLSLQVRERQYPAVEGQPTYCKLEYYITIRVLSQNDLPNYLQNLYRILKRKSGTELSLLKELRVGERIHRVRLLINIKRK